VNSNVIRNSVIGLVIVLFLFAVYSQTIYRRPAPPPRVFAENQDIDVNITLVSTDAKNLACVSPEELNGYHCEFQTRSERWSKPSTTGRPPAVDTLAPYKTTDDYLFLVPGLFSQQALKDRLAIDPPVQGNEHMRFVANCKMHIEGKVRQADVRWATNGPWQIQHDVWVGSVSGCWLSDG